MILSSGDRFWLAWIQEGAPVNREATPYPLQPFAFLFASLPPVRPTEFAGVGGFF